jgi:hypothetical protein
MKSLLLVLAYTCVLLFPAPALAQTTQGGPSGDQYGDNVGVNAAHGAMHAALLASGAIRATSEEAQATEGDSVVAAEPSNVPSERDAAFAEEGDAVSFTEAHTESASMAEAQGESANTSDVEKLPDTGGPSPLWLFGAPLICIGGIISRRILLA